MRIIKRLINVILYLPLIVLGVALAPLMYILTGNSDKLFDVLTDLAHWTEE